MTTLNPVLRQAGIIAYRVVDGEFQILLITSRDTGRWIIPRGNVAGGSTPWRAAEKEAFEEAGIKGSKASPIPVGVYTYAKKLETGEVRPAMVEVYLLRATKQAGKWPEKSQRRLVWVSPKQAVALLDDPGLLPLMERLIELEPELKRCGQHRPAARSAGGRRLFRGGA